MRIRPIGMGAAAFGLTLVTAWTAAICAPPTQVPPDAAEVQQIRKDLAEIGPQLQQAYGDLETVMRGIDRTRIDPQAVIELVGRDPQKLFEWVRDQTDALPHPRALRGSVGVLMERGGNSLDRSLLLAELLQGTGYEVRLANARLPAEQAQDLYTRLLKSTPHADPVVDTPEAVKTRLRVQALADQLIKALGGNLPGTTAAQTRLAEALADHWWVQRREVNGWVDMDLSGLPPRAPARTVALSARGGLSALAPADCHEVELRIVIEAFKGGRLQTDSVLKQTLRPAELLGRTINFTHYVGKAAQDADAAIGPGAAAKLKAALVQQDVFLPTLRIDSRPITEASFTTAGEIDRNPQLDPTGKLAGATNKTTGGVFGGLTGAGPAKTSSGVLTAEWIEYEVSVPGEKPQTIRREIFDLIGPAARAASVKQSPSVTDDQKLSRVLMLASQTQILLQPCELPANFVEFKFSRDELKEKNFWLKLSQGQVDTPAKLKGLLGPLAFRDDTTTMVPVIRSAASASGGTFINQPNIVHHRRWLQAGPGDTWLEFRAIDLAATGAAALDGGNEGSRHLLERGVAETLAEHLALGPEAQPTENTAAIFETAQQKGTAPIVVRSDADLASAKIALPPDTSARVSGDLHSGHIAVLCGAADQRWTWWRVDAQTFQTVGVMDTGLNGTTERAELEAEIEQNNLITGNKLKWEDYQNKTPDFGKWAKGNDVDREALQRLWSKIQQYEIKQKMLTARFMSGMF